MIKAIAFLGNIGQEYKNTRHNTAWLFADTIEAVRNARWQHKFKGQFAAVESMCGCLDTRPPSCGIGGHSGCGVHIQGSSANSGKNHSTARDTAERLYLLKPETYMNLSGESAAAMASFYRIKSEEILVVHDEIELPLGTISLKWSGGLGGHNGLRSMKASLGTADFWRLRFGVGKPSTGGVADYVLSPFTEDELITLSRVFDAGRECLCALLCAKDAHSLIPKWGKITLL